MEVDDDIKSMLNRGEQILYKANQSRFKPGGSKFTSNTIYVTNQRLFHRDPKWLGLKKDYEEVYFRDINNLRLNKGIFSTEIIISSRFQDEPLVLEAVGKREAEQIGGLIRKGMEGILPGQRLAETRSSPRVIQEEPEKDPIEQLEKLGRLKEQGIISEEEFELKKKELLSKI